MTTLVIPDLHCPYQHADAFDFLADLARRFKPDRAVCIGDEIDAHAFGRWPRSPDLDGPGVELTKAVAALKSLYKLFPKVEVCVSNHTYRPWKQAGEAGLPSRLLRDVREVLEAPRGWSWKEWVEIDGVLYFHGDGFGGPYCARDAAVRHRRSVVIGHVHTAAGVWWTQTRWDRIFGASTGALIDSDKAAFNYARHNPGRAVLGTVAVVDRVPQFVPMEG